MNHGVVTYGRKNPCRPASTLDALVGTRESLPSPLKDAPLSLSLSLSLSASLHAPPVVARSASDGELIHFKEVGTCGKERRAWGVATCEHLAVGGKAQAAVDPSSSFTGSALLSRMASSRGRGWILLCLCILISLKADGYFVDITYVGSAVAKGAVCLDGSPPAYHFSPGFGSGVNNWLVQIEGGGWCNNVTTCLARKDTRLGSSKAMVKQLAFSGIFSNKQPTNPDFFNWNKVKVRYCDGSSFTGDVERVDPVTNLYFRGARVFQAVMEDLLAKGMSHAQNALLSGCSAGGLTSILHCDNFRSLLPGANVKCLSDAGYFINAKDITGTEHIRQFYNDVVTTHGSAKNLPSSCTSRLNPGMCMFPQYVAQGIRTPLFILNAAYDSWQIKNTLAPGVADPHGTWHDCKVDIKKCSTGQIDVMQGFRQQFLGAVTSLGSNPSRGLFINSCYAHCQSEMQETWLRDDSPKLDGTTIAKAVGDWFYGRSGFQKIDCAYPCDTTCHNRIFE